MWCRPLIPISRRFIGFWIRRPAEQALLENLIPSRRIVRRWPCLAFAITALHAVFWVECEDEGFLSMKNDRLKVLATLLLAVGLMTVPGLGLAKGGAKLTKAETEASAPEIAWAEEWLRQVKTLEARFLQSDDMGNERQGRVWLSRPGKMRLEYDAPRQDLVVADGLFVHVWDAGLGESSSVPLDSSPAALLLRDNLALNGKDVAVTGVLNYPGGFEVTLTQRDKKDAGNLTLVFETAPLALRQWRITDPQGLVTRVTLQDLRPGGEIDSQRFVYVNPNFGKK